MIALAANGKAATDMASRRGRFSFVAPAKKVTLHLRKRGRYAGPIVLDMTHKGSRAIVGAKAGARLGLVRVKRGYATVSEALDATALDAKRTALAKRGVPIGARNYGRVRARRSAPARPGQDSDLDGIPQVLDVDDDGDLVLDEVDRSVAASAAQAGDEFRIGAHYVGGKLSTTVNANAADLTAAQLDSAFSERAGLAIPFLPGDSAELDCGPPVPQGLSYCAAGGTGQVAFGPFDGQDFPGCCDGDRDGFGTLVNSVPGNPGPGFMALAHRATTSQVLAGQVLVARVTTGGVETPYPTVLGLVLATTPALVSYSDTAAHSASVKYPVAPLGPGTEFNPFPVAAGPDGRIVMTFTVWRPQRKPIPPEESTWIDIGGLRYGVGIDWTPDLGPPGLRDCPLSSMSTADPELSPASDSSGVFDAGMFIDLADDRPASKANTFSYTVDFSDCLAAINEQLGNQAAISWDPGEKRAIGMPAHPAITNDNVAAGGTGQTVYFQRVEEE